MLHALSVRGPLRHPTTHQNQTKPLDRHALTDIPFLFWLRPLQPLPAPLPLPLLAPL